MSKSYKLTVEEESEFLVRKTIMKLDGIDYCIITSDINM